MSAAALLDRLDGVRRTGNSRWLACCPGHDDRRPSLSIRELDDGRVLVHDFAGCSVEEVLTSVGLDFDALFPDRPAEHRVRGARAPFGARDVLQALSSEVLIVHIYSTDLRAGLAVSHKDHERFLLAASRIRHAWEYCDGK